MSNGEKTGSKKKIIIGIVGLIVLIVAAALIYAKFSPKATKGAKEISIEVIDDAGASTEYTVQTDAEFLRQAMEEADGLEFEGTESDYGLMVETVNGVTADYNADGAYWAFYLDGEYCQYGIDNQPVEDGQEYQIVYSK